MFSATSTVARKRLLILTAVLLACAAWYAAHLDLSLFVSDDGGITLRYAERIASGRGFNYNDGEAVNGASNPLYTLLLAMNLRLGLTPQSAIVAIAVPAFAATTGLLFYTFARHWSLFAGMFSLLAFWSTRFLFTYLFDALEPTLTLFLAALLFHALHTRSFAYQGIALGLLVANKLDGSFAAIGFAIVWLLARRRFPIGAAVAALLTALPMFLLLLISFGSIVPNSALQKARFMHTLTGGGFHPLWVSDTLRGMLPSLYMPALMSFLLPGGPSRNFARYVIQLWLLIHVAFYSSVDLGAPHPWYCSLPAFLLVILATITAHSIYHLLARDNLEAKGSERPVLARAWARVLPIGILLVYFFNYGWPEITGRMRSRDGPDRIQPSVAGEIGRQAAGAWLRKHTSGTELLYTGYGLPAFEYKGPVFDAVLLNSRSDPSAVERAQYVVHGPYPDGKTAQLARGEKQLVATFQYGSGADMYAVYASRESEVVRKNLCHMQLSLASLHPVHSGTSEPLEGSELNWRGNLLFVRTPSDLCYSFSSPCLPSLCIAPEARIPGGLSSTAMVRVRINGETVLEEVLPTGAAGSQRILRAPRTSPSGEYRVELLARETDDQARALWVLWGNAQVRTDDPLDASDFSLMCEPWARRIERVNHASSQ